MRRGVGVRGGGGLLFLRVASEGCSDAGDSLLGRGRQPPRASFGISVSLFEGRCAHCGGVEGDAPVAVFRESGLKTRWV